MSPFRNGIALSVVAAIAALTSSCVAGKVRIAYPGTEDCVQGCDFVAGGWPFLYVVDQHGLSPAGSTDLLGALLGLDIFRPWHLVATYVFWLAVFVAARRIHLWTNRRKTLRS